MDQPGRHSVLAGKYRLIHQLGKGGMGAVWYAEHLTLESPVAIKLIDPEIAANPEGVARFLREAKAAASLRSPHVVQILDHGVDYGVPYIAMELLEGESLAGRLERVGRLSPDEAARVLTQVARALSRAHAAGITHRDLKPENIFLIRNDEEEIAKVLDFGIAKHTSPGLAASASGGTQSGTLLGTLHYMSPEQAEGLKSLDFKTDIWAMGVIAFECLVGHRPFESEAIGSLLLAICSRPLPVPSQSSSVPRGFDEWFVQACARDVNRRFASAKEAAAELRRICEPDAPPRSRDANSSRDSEMPAERDPRSAVTKARVAAQSVVGVSTTNRRSRPTRPNASSGLVVALAAALLVVIAIGLFMWIRPGAGSASSGSVTAQTLVASVPLQHQKQPSLHPTVTTPTLSPPVPAPSATASSRGRSIMDLPQEVIPNPPGPSPVPRPPPTRPKASATPAPPENPKVNLGF